MADNINNESVNRLNEILNRLDRSLSSYDRAKRDVGYFSDRFSGAFEKDSAEVFRRIADFAGGKNAKFGGGSKFWGGIDKGATKLQHSLINMSTGLSKAVPYLAAFKVGLDLANAGLKMYNQYQRDQMEIDKKKAELEFTKERAITDIRKKNIELVGFMIQQKVSTIGTTVNEALKNTLSVFNDKNLTQTALAAANSMSKNATSLVGMDLELRLKRMQTEFDIENVKIQRDLDVVTQMEGIRQAELAQTEHIVTGATGAVGLNSVGGYASTGFDVARVESEQRQTIAMLENYSQKIQQLHREIGIEGQRMFKDAVKQSMDFMQQQYSALVTFTSDFENAFYSINEKSLSVGRAMGMSEVQLYRYQHAFAELSKTAAAFGKTEEDVQKIQDAYIKSTGRNILLSSSDLEDILSLSTVFDVDSTTITNTLASMNVFNVSVKSGSGYLEKMLKIADQMGLSVKKFSESMDKTVQLSKRYNFKGGVEGAMEMALWAEKARFNMDSIGGVIDKIQTGNIADVIRMSAQLNVLGGMPAVNSDPIGMLFDATNNPRGLAGRIRDSLRGLGTWNEKTGMADFRGQQMLINQIAAGFGISSEEARNMAQQLHKEEQMAGILRGYTEEQKAFLMNTARWNNGHWDVSRYDTNSAVNLNEAHLTEEELKNVIPNDDTKQLVDYAKLNLDEQKKQTSIMLASKFGIINESMDEFMRQSDTRKAVISSFMANNKDLMISGMSKTSEQMTRDLENQFKITEATLSNTDETITTIGGLAEDFARNFPEQYKEMKDLLLTPQNAYESIPKIYQTLEGIANQLGVDLSFEGASEMPSSGNAKTFSDLKAMAKKSDNGASMAKEILDNYDEYREMFKNLTYGDRRRFEDMMDDVTEVDNNWSRFLRLVGDGLDRQAAADILGRITGNGAESVRLGKYIRDGVSVGSSFVGANSVVPINDGVVAKTAPNDVGIFAKSGGPFDTLFNGIFGKINKIEQGLSGNATLNCNFGGKIDLVSNGQSVNILEVIKKDPILMKKLADAIVLQITASNNYGRYNSPLERKYVSVGR